jgi:4-diphosphocytidyl-2C-methyl-D-erythritol kinase
MSGSGSTVFAVLRLNAGADLLAERAKAELDPELWTCACETRQRTPASPSRDRELSFECAQWRG